LKTKDKNTPDYAMFTYLLGMDYAKQNESSKAIRYYAESAALDVKFAIKDNASMQELALLLNATGDIDNAYRCTQSAIEDALFSDSKFRTLHISEFYAIINTAYLKKEAKQQDQLRIYLILISTLSLFLAGFAVYVYKQLKRESRIKKALNSTTVQLSELNRTLNSTNLRLNEANSQLLEANKIKEVYIAQFFDLCSAYINKLENFRKVLNKKATEKHLDELLKMLRSNALINEEVEELYRIFDKIFLSLYPNFICDFNSLLIPEERIMVKPGELLNTELRIYALVRLGITDSIQIAAFLRYSLSTIYNYRTSARNKAAVSRDVFEQKVMRIGLIESG
jgi:DNA-binding CsgD family transcriptional regulator